VDELETHCQGPVLVAVDHELGGIQRLAHLVAPLPSAAQAAALPVDELTERARRTGLDLAALGVTLVLGPIVDVVRGRNPWLHRRNLGPDADVVARVGAALVTGLQSGGVAATAKHFPGHSVVRTDPATEVAVVDTTIEELRQVDLRPFRAVIGCVVQAIMLGPAVVIAIDDARPASRSPATVQLLRDELGFEGAIITDDLDARSIVGDGDLSAGAVEALAAGADLLLVSEEHGVECAVAITSAIARGVLQPERLQRGVRNVRNLSSPRREHAMHGHSGIGRTVR